MPHGPALVGLQAMRGTYSRPLNPLPLRGEILSAPLDSRRLPEVADRYLSTDIFQSLGLVDKAESHCAVIMIQGWKMGAGLGPEPHRRRDVGTACAVSAADPRACMPPSDRQSARSGRDLLDRPDRLALARSS